MHTTELAARIIAGEVVACPAEAVWGLSCDPFNPAAVAKILTIKRRDVAKGLIIAAADEAQLAPVLAAVSDAIRRELSLSWPGSNTWLLPNNDVFPSWITGASDEVAVRVTSAPALVALCRAVGHPLVSTSANPSSALPAKFAFQVARYFGPKLPRCRGSVDLSAKPSTIRRATSGEVLRA